MSHSRKLLFAVLPLSLALAAPANATCPENSEEISRTTRGDKTDIFCRCLGERLRYGGKCVAPEEVPLTTKTLAVMTGRAFTVGSALLGYPRKENWSAPAIHYWNFSILEAEFGRYKRARAFLEMARNYIKTDPVVVTLDTTFLELQRKKKLARRFLNDPPDEDEVTRIEEYLKHTKVPGLRAAYNRDLIEGRFHRERGDYEAAISKYKGARWAARRLRGGVELQRTANDGIVWSRQLRASWKESQNPGIAAGLKSYNRMRGNDMAAARAEFLAIHLAHAGQGKAAIAYLEEARAYYQKMDPNKSHKIIGKKIDVRRAGYVAKQIARLQADEKAFELRKTKDGRPLTFYTNVRSQTDIMFDAMEYGKGDWSKSIKYLEVALSADPKNKKIFSALDDVKRLSAAK